MACSVYMNDFITIKLNWVSCLRGKTKLRNLQKDHDEMEQRLKALREGSSLLTNLQKLNTTYLKHRTAHPNEVETVRKSAVSWFGVELAFLLSSVHKITVQANHFVIFVGFIVLWSINHFASVFCLTVWPILYACYVDGSQVHHGNRVPAKDCQWPSTAGLRWKRKWITNTLYSSTNKQF